jgi:hypothetical protein
MFYRPGGSVKAINRQYDAVYADAAGLATGWLPISKGDTVAVNIARASITFVNAALSTVIMSPIAPEAIILMEMRMFGSDPASTLWPIDQWQNMVVATSRRAHRNGWVRLRILAINAQDGTGINMALQISRTGDVGAQT